MESKNWCENCTNKNTPLCTLCKSVTTVTGEEKKPSYHVGYDEILLPHREAHINDLSAIIEYRAKRQQPIPIRYVIDYNKLLED